MKEELLRAGGERDELLILVAELDEEREGMRTQVTDLSTIQKPPFSSGAGATPGYVPAGPTNGGGGGGGSGAEQQVGNISVIRGGGVDSTDTSLQFDAEDVR